MSLQESTLTLLSPHLSTTPHAPQGGGVMKVLQNALVLKACCLDQPHLLAPGADRQASRSGFLQNNWMQSLQGAPDVKHSLEVTSVLVLLALTDSRLPSPMGLISFGALLQAAGPSCFTGRENQVLGPHPSALVLSQCSKVSLASWDWACTLLSLPPGVLLSFIFLSLTFPLAAGLWGSHYGHSPLHIHNCSLGAGL